jgi:MFS family permease
VAARQSGDIAVNPASGSPLWLRVFLPFAAGYYFSYLLRTVNAVIAPELTRELGLSAADLGLLTSTYFFTFAAFQIPLGMLLDRFGPRRVEAALLLFAAGGCALFALGQNLIQLGAARALIGLGVSACLMASFKSFHQWFPAERQPSLVGAIMVAGGLGALTSSVPLELVLPAMGWRGVFWAVAALGVVVAAAVFTVPDHSVGIASETLGAAWRGVVQVFRSAVFWRYAPQNCITVGGFMAVQGLWAVPWLMTTNGFTRAVAAQHLFFMSIAMLIGYLGIAILTPALTRRGIKPAMLLASGILLGLVCAVLILLDAGPTRLLWVLYGFAASSGNLAYPLLTAAFPAQFAGRVNTAYNLMAFVGAFGVQWGFGAVVDLARAAGNDPAPSFRIAFAVLIALQAAAFTWYAWRGRQCGGDVGDGTS